MRRWRLSNLRGATALRANLKPPFVRKGVRTASGLPIRDWAAWARGSKHFF